MTSIKAVSSHLPPHATPIGECFEDLGIDRTQVDFYQRVFGNARVRRDPRSSIVEQMIAAVDGLSGLKGREDRVRYLVQARTIQLGVYRRSPLREVRDKLGLGGVTTFSVSQQACASGLLAVDVCGKLLATEEDPDALALLLAGEKTFSRITRVMGAAVLGEGVAAVLIGRGDGDRLLGYATRTRGEFNDALGTPPELQPRFNEVYAPTMAEVITSALARAGLTPQDVSLILPHNVNRTGWAKVARALDLAPERIYLDNLPELGHCFCADPFINYRSACQQARLRPGDYYVMSTVGAGATWAAMVFQYRGGQAPPDRSAIGPSATSPTDE
jgi:3-oxoacyl-[acyl-carrier-protein] synthase III